MSEFNLYLNNILMMVYRIENSSKKSKLNFRDTTFYDATLMRLQVIGETIKCLPKEKRVRYRDVNWKIFTRFRDIVSHNYFIVNHNALRKIILTELPKLKKAIRSMRK